MTTSPLAHTITMQHGPLTLDLKAEAPSPQGFAAKFSRHVNSLVVRIALPPLAIWGALYSLVEYMA